MKELNTIQKREKLNRVFSVDEEGPGGANHEYVIVSDKGLQVPKETKLVFQKGARNEIGSQHGVLDTDLLEIVRDRYKAFQAGPFASEYNEKALEHIEIALMYANRRVEDRIERNVLGTNNK
ncbi:MAG: ABC transporter ATPase [Clostridium sp.]|uniref:ABC transporter ATPase n=1 Tax=Clostridium sp. TaxID=1506 RepID=UPI002FCB0B90